MPGTDYRESSHTHKSSKQSLMNEPQNSRSSQRLLLPLEPDFSAMSDPSVIIDLPATFPLLGKYLNLDRVEEISLSQNISLRREEDLDHHLLPFLDLPLCLLIREAGNQRGPDTHIRRRSTSSSSSSSSSLQSIHDYSRYKRQRQSPQVVDV